MSDIFISYAREDRDKAELLARAFEQQKWVVWWDKVIPPGRKYADVIGQELASAKAVIVLWSAASVSSDWVKDEAQEGANRAILVPALVENVSPPYGFRQLQTADLSDWGRLIVARGVAETRSECRRPHQQAGQRIHPSEQPY